MAIRLAAKARAPSPLATRPIRECALFDGNGKPRDQPCDLVQIAGIVIPQRARKPSEAFVVAHRGGVVRNDGGYRSNQVGQNVWH
jgi:hypothetical protein